MIQTSIGRVGLAVVAMLTLPAALFAADGGHKDPMQLELVNMITTLVVFGGLVLILTKYAWKPILTGLQAREDAIKGALDAALKTKSDAEGLQQQLAAKLAAANDEIRKMIDHARADANQIREDMVGKAKADIQQERDRLHREIGTARDQAMQELWKQSVQLATLLSAKTIRRELSHDDHRRLVDEALVELQRAASNGEGSPLASAKT